METDNTSLNEKGKLEESVLQSICDIIRKYNADIKGKLEFIVAALCDVDVREMMTDTKHMYNTHARWLYWYAHRYMTDDSYKSMAKNKKWGRKFTLACVSNCTQKMSIMITSNTVWTKRWAILKRIIKESLDVTWLVQEMANKDVTIKVTAPKGVNVELKQE